MGVPEILEMLNTALKKHQKFVPVLNKGMALNKIPPHLVNALKLLGSKVKNSVLQLEKDLKVLDFNQDHHIHIHFANSKVTSSDSLESFRRGLSIWFDPVSLVASFFNRVTSFFDMGESASVKELLRTWQATRYSFRISQESLLRERP